MLRRWLLRPAPAPTPPPDTRGGAGLTVTSLGTAGFIVEAAGRSLVLDPYVSRASLWETAFTRLRSDPALVRRWIPRADDVLIGHAHHDHLLDAPTVCLQTGARLIGSPATLHVGRAAGVPEAQLVEATPNCPMACGAWAATALPSIHGKAFLGRIPLPGDISAPPPWPPRVWDLRHGQVYNWHLAAPGVKVVHIDSADYLDAQLDGLEADVLLLCAVGRQYRRDYTRGVIERLRPKIVIPCHWDDFTTPLDASPRQLPGVDAEGFVEEIRACGAWPLVLPLGGSVAL